MAEQAVFNAPMVSSGFAHELFDENSLSEVIWDRDVSDELFNERSVPEVIWDEEFTHKEMPNDHAGQEGLDELPYVNVIWDEELTDTETVVGEDWVYADQKQVPILASVVWDSAEQEGPDVAPSVDVVWDADLQLAQRTEEMMCEQVPLEAPILLEEMNQGGDFFVGMERKLTDEPSDTNYLHTPVVLPEHVEFVDSAGDAYEMLNDMSLENVICDEEVMPDHDTHNLWQLLASGKEHLDSKKATLIEGDDVEDTMWDKVTPHNLDLQLVLAKLQSADHCVFITRIDSMKIDCLSLDDTQSWGCGRFSQGSNATHTVLEKIPTRKHGEISLSDKHFLYAAQIGTMEFNLSGHNWERWSSRSYIDVALDQLCEDAAARSVFLEAVHSNKQGIFIVHLAHKALSSEFICFRSDERSFSQWNKEAFCQKIFLLIWSMKRPWDPGITQWIQGGEDLTGNAKKPTAEFSQQSAYLVQEETKSIVELVITIGDVLTQNKCSSFILDASIYVGESMFEKMDSKSIRAVILKAVEILINSHGGGSSKLQTSMGYRICYGEWWAYLMAEGIYVVCVVGGERSLILNLDVHEDVVQLLDLGNNMLNNVIDLPLFLQSGDAMAVEEKSIAINMDGVLWPVRMQWDLGIVTATAWGQAVFRGGGNVMAQERPKVVKPSHQVTAQPKPKHYLRSSASNTGRGSEQKNQKQRRTGGRLPPPIPQRSYPIPSRSLLLVLTLLVDLAGVATGITPLDEPQ